MGFDGSAYMDGKPVIDGVTGWCVLCPICKFLPENHFPEYRLYLLFGESRAQL